MKPSHRFLSYIRLATNVALGSDCEFHHGAVLFDGGRVLNVSANKPSYNKFAARFKRNFPTLHAEIGAVLGMSKAMTNGAEVLVVRVNKRGQIMFSKPCKMCQAVLRFCGVRRVFYTLGQGDELGEVSL